MHIHTENASVLLSFVGRCNCGHGKQWQHHSLTEPSENAEEGLPIIHPNSSDAWKNMRRKMIAQSSRNTVLSKGAGVVVNVQVVKSNSHFIDQVSHPVYYLLITKIDATPDGMMSA